MANTLGIYDPIFYAQEALIQLEKALGMAFWVHRGYDKAPQRKGSTVSIRRPGTFTAQNMPIASAADIVAEDVDVTLDQWKGVVFSLTDKEVTFTTEQIINEHIRPAAYAVADAIDLSLCGLYKDIPYFYNTADPGAVTDFTGTRQVMFDNKVPNGNRALMINGEREADYLGLAVFHQANTAGADGMAAQREGFLGRKFGFNIFANQNVQTHVTGTTGAGDNAGTVNGAHVIGATTVAVTALEAAGTIKAGDIVTIGNYSYTAAADLTLSTGAGNLVITETTEGKGLREALSGGEAVTVRNQAKLVENLAFHRNAFALAMAPLSDIGNQAGARMGVASDPITNLALRSRLWYEGKESAVYVGIDALWGVKTLDDRLAVRMNS